METENRNNAPNNRAGRGPGLLGRPGRGRGRGRGNETRGVDVTGLPPTAKMTPPPGLDGMGAPPTQPPSETALFMDMFQKFATQMEKKMETSDRQLLSLVQEIKDIKAAPTKQIAIGNDEK